MPKHLDSREKVLVPASAVARLSRAVEARLARLTHRNGAEPFIVGSCSNINDPTGGIPS